MNNAVVFMCSAKYFLETQAGMIPSTLDSSSVQQSITQRTFGATRAAPTVPPGFSIYHSGTCVSLSRPVAHDGAICHGCFSQQVILEGDQHSTDGEPLRIYNILLLGQLCTKREKHHQ